MSKSPITRELVHNVPAENMCLLQVWLLVQRKWMYLESIFLGGDISSQLPEEAKKFDNMDKKFKEVSFATI